jgi:hypothetical protein
VPSRRWFPTSLYPYILFILILTLFYVFFFRIGQIRKIGKLIKNKYLFHPWERGTLQALVHHLLIYIYIMLMLTFFYVIIFILGNRTNPKRIILIKRKFFFFTHGNKVPSSRWFPTSFYIYILCRYRPADAFR